MKAEPQKEHAWLQRFVGNWTYEFDATPEPGPSQPGQSPPGQSPPNHKGSESVRSLDGIWIVAEGKLEMPGGAVATTIMTLGYDPRRERFVGTWLGTMMTHLWLYEGSLNAAENVLTLDAEGPDMSAEGKITKYQDIVEFKSNDHRILTSRILGDDGQWRQFMTAHFRRT